MRRVVIAGMLGGVALFLWSSVWHLASGLGAVGIHEIPNEQAVLDGMSASIRAPGLYLFPGMGRGPGATHEQQSATMKAIQQKAETGPNGILVIHPNGGGGFTAARLSNEFVLNVVQALLLAGILAWAGAPGSYAGRVAFATVVGLFGALATNVQILELVRVPNGLHIRVHPWRGCWVSRGRPCSSGDCEEVTRWRRERLRA